jgi:hypothetical protein
MAIAALLCAIPSCYTILKHPTVLEEDYTQAETQRCTDCHYESDLWHYNHPHTPFRSGIGYRDPWVRYYDIPWWYESSWFYNDVKNPETMPLHERTLRPGEDKSPISPGHGEFIGPPPSQKPGVSTVKTKIETKDEKKDDAESSTKDETRSIRPSKKKKKDN